MVYPRPIVSRPSGRLTVVLCLGLALATLAALPSALLAAAHWSYNGEEGPERWAGLDRDWAVCASGQQQSPIDLGGATAKDLVNPQLAYQPGDGRVVNNGHTVQVTLDSANTMTLDGGTFTLSQFHFHSPSEHTVGGSSYPAELHLVHAASDGSLAVLGVLIQVGAENPALSTIIAAMPAKADKEARLPASVDPTELLPGDRRAYRYTGSLTTPPCSEGVRWVVMSTPITASVNQISALARVLHGNSRPAQTRGSRELLLDSSP